MRKIFFSFLFLLLIVSLIVVKVSAQNTNQPVPKATGDVWMSGPPSQQWDFNAFDYGDPTLDKGTVQYWNYDVNLNYTANVFCAHVYGKSANFAFQIPNGNPYAGTFIVVALIDNGSPGANLDTLGFNIASDRANAITQCGTNNLETSINYPITAGNLVVH